MDTQPIYAAEREKYDRMWAVDDYRKVSFGEQLVGPFLAIAKPKPGSFIADVGCGTGRASLKLRQLQMHVAMLDACESALDPDVREASKGSLSMWFYQTCVWRDWPTVIGSFDYAYCCDVLEHIPTEFTMMVVERCLQAHEGVFLHINFDPDCFGQVIGQPLHLTVQPYQWWRDRLADVGLLVDARDMLGHGTFYLKGGR